MQDTDGLTHDAFLGGRVVLRQPAKGYRAGLDPVLLAAAVPALGGQKVLELGCGVGAALFCLGARVPGLSLCGVELQPDYAALARENAVANEQAASIATADLRALPSEIRQSQFDHVIANPPYYPPNQGTTARDRGRSTALSETIPLADWVSCGVRRLAPRGMLSVIQRADRLPDLLSAMAPTLGGLMVRPLHPRTDRPASLVIVRGQKDTRAPFRLCPPLMLHKGAHHETDRETYTAEIQAVLRDGAALPGFS